MGFLSLTCFLSNVCYTYSCRQSFPKLLSHNCSYPVRKNSHEGYIYVMGPSQLRIFDSYGVVLQHGMSGSARSGIQLVLNIPPILYSIYSVQKGHEFLQGMSRPTEQTILRKRNLSISTSSFLETDHVNTGTSVTGA